MSISENKINGLLLGCNNKVSQKRTSKMNTKYENKKGNERDNSIVEEYVNKP